MQISELQDFASWVQTRLDDRFGDNEDIETQALLSLWKITEELWELSEQVLMWRGRQRNEKGDFDIANLEKEIADVIIATALLWDQLWIDLDTAIQDKLEKLKKRRESF